MVSGLGYQTGVIIVSHKSACPQTCIHVYNLNNYVNCYIMYPLLLFPQSITIRDGAQYACTDTPYDATPHGVLVLIPPTMLPPMVYSCCYPHDATPHGLLVLLPPMVSSYCYPPQCYPHGILVLPPPTMLPP